MWSSDQKCDLFYKVGLVICHFEDQHAFVGSLGMIVNLWGNCRIFVNTVQYLVCRTLLCETQTDLQVQTIFAPQGVGHWTPPVRVLPCPSFSILWLGLLIVAYWYFGRTSYRNCLNEDQASKHWKAIWKTKGLQIWNQDPRLSQKQYFVVTHPYEQRATMMKHVFVNGCDHMNRTEDPNRSMQVNFLFQESMCRVWISSLLERLVWKRRDAKNASSTL